MRVGDVSDVVPQRRMAVVRGRLEAATPTELWTSGPAACLNAVKRASELMPELAPFQLTHCETDIAAVSGGTEVTVTVQGFGRAPLSSAAMLGAAACLGAIMERLESRAQIRMSLSLVEDIAH